MAQPIVHLSDSGFLKVVFLCGPFLGAWGLGLGVYAFRGVEFGGLGFRGLRFRGLGFRA